MGCVRHILVNPCQKGDNKDDDDDDDDDDDNNNNVRQE